MKLIYKIYDSVQLHLGIKKFLSEYILKDKILCWIDNYIVFPIYELLEKYFFKRVVSHYGADYHWGDEKSQNLSIKKNNFGFGYYHYAFIRNKRPKKILCIGSMYGFIPYMMAKACRENRKGHVDFVDAGYDINDDGGKNYYGQGFWRKINPNEHFSYLKVNKYLSTYVMTSAEFAKINKEKYDYVYLDGDHSYKGAAENMKLFWTRLNNEGFVCFHDIHFDRVLRGMLFEHGKMWKDLSKMPFKYEISNHYSGLGFLQKLTKDDPLKMIQKK